jgi:uncharacterized protein (DUF169 family)
MPEFGELSRLVSAAVVNQDFCKLLLSNPAMALTTGYYGERFHLALQEEQLILSIQATTLVEFARQIATTEKPVHQPYR